MTETLWRGGNYPVAIGGVVVTRAQNFSVDSNRGVDEVYQLGNDQIIDAIAAPEDVTGSLTWYPINTLVENAIVGVASSTSPVTLSNFLSTSGVTITGPTGARGINGAKLTSLEYTIDVPTGFWQATAQFSGTSWDADGAAITPDTPTGTGAYRSPKVMVQFSGSNITLLRIQRLRVSLRITQDKAYELSNASAFDVLSMTPQVSGEITWHANYESGTAGAHSIRPLPDMGSEEDIVIQVGNGAWNAVGNLKYTLKSVSWERRSQGVQVRQRGTETIMYRGTGDATTGGFQATVIAV